MVSYADTYYAYSMARGSIRNNSIVWKDWTSCSKTITIEKDLIIISDEYKNTFLEVGKRTKSYVDKDGDYRVDFEVNAGNYQGTGALIINRKGQVRLYFYFRKETVVYELNE